MSEQEQEESGGSSWPQWLFKVPFLRIQTLLQTQDLIPHLKWNPVKGAIECAKKIKREEGFRYFWKSGIPCIMLSISQSFFQSFSTGFLLKIEFEDDEEGENKTKEQEISKSIESSDSTREGGEFQDKDTPIQESKTREDVKKKETGAVYNFSKPGLPLSIAVMTFGLITQPLQVLRVRIGSDFKGPEGTRYSGMLDAARKLVKSGGIGALFRGYVPITLSMLAHQNLVSYLTLRKEELSYMDTALFTLAEAAMFPFEVVAARMIMWHDNGLGKYKRMTECFRGTYKEFGIRGLFKGFQVSLFYLFGGMLLSQALGYLPLDEIEE